MNDYIPIEDIPNEYKRKKFNERKNKVVVFMRNVAEKIGNGVRSLASNVQSNKEEKKGGIIDKIRDYATEIHSKTITEEKQTKKKKESKRAETKPDNPFNFDVGGFSLPTEKERREYMKSRF